MALRLKRLLSGAYYVRYLISYPRRPTHCFHPNIHGDHDGIPFYLLYSQHEQSKQAMKLTHYLFRKQLKN